MRFKKGTKVEVLTQMEVPSGSWRSAEIIEGNGHYYTVRYDGSIGFFGESMLERVPRKAIRPCPPSVDVLEDWMPGDVVEVYHNYSWKMATVLKVLGWNYLLVRLLGSSLEFKSDKYDVRARLCWQDGEWILIGKAFNKCEDPRFRLPSSRKGSSSKSQKMDTVMSRHKKGDHIATMNSSSIPESQPIHSRTLKRKPSHCHYQIESYASPNRKIRVGVKDSMRQQFDIMHGEKCINPSFINKITGNSETVMETEKNDGAVGSSRSISVESNDDDSVSSSVGSCSVNHSHKLHNLFAAGRFEDDDSQCSDAESFCQSRSEEGNRVLPAKEELKEEIHRLELHAYRRTIGALHASGPLSWEQELLLTNLRDSLHISNDEHLMEIRNLVSSSS